MCAWPLSHKGEMYEVILHTNIRQKLSSGVPTHLESRRPIGVQTYAPSHTRCNSVVKDSPSLDWSLVIMNNLHNFSGPTKVCRHLGHTSPPPLPLPTGPAALPSRAPPLPLLPSPLRFPSSSLPYDIPATLLALTE